MRWRSIGATIGCSAKRCQRRKLQSHLAGLRQTTRQEWLALNSQTLQQICDRLYLGWQAFFDGHAKRPPTFKKRRKYRSITFKQSGSMAEFGSVHAPIDSGRVKPLRE